MVTVLSAEVAGAVLAFLLYDKVRNKKNTLCLCMYPCMYVQYVCR